MLYYKILYSLIFDKVNILKSIDNEWIHIAITAFESYLYRTYVWVERVMFLIQVVPNVYDFGNFTWILNILLICGAN